MTIESISLRIGHLGGYIKNREKTQNDVRGGLSGHRYVGYVMMGLRNEIITLRTDYAWRGQHSMLMERKTF